MATTTDPAELLQRHIPVLRYDSQEPYFADAASEWTDNPGNQLKRADGTVIAAAIPTDGQPALSLGFLGPTRYANGDAALAVDRIGVTSKDYVAQAQGMHAQSQYANRVYGHSAMGSDDGCLWLAYWFFYFYNGYNLIGRFIRAGLHESDWEMIQLRLDPTGAVPDLAVYAQHKHAGQRPWNQVERVGDQPVVYPARGSHASYFSAGVHWTGDWFDFATASAPRRPSRWRSCPTSPVPTAGRFGRGCGAAPPLRPTTPTRSTTPVPEGLAATRSTRTPTCCSRPPRPTRRLWPQRRPRPHRMRPPYPLPPQATTFRSLTTRTP